MDRQKWTKPLYKLLTFSSILVGFSILFTQVCIAEEQKPYNRLIHEKSPYLLQHSKNPIWWYPWGEKAFEAARRENKPIFLSIGYSTCHWCHVMEGDSFENEEVAALLNQYFIAIKVDREERPDVDQIYMDILVAMNGYGGWPVTMFLTHELVPFTGATFVPRKQFMGLLQQIGQVWQQDQQQIEKVGKQVTVWLNKQAAQRFLDAPLPEDDIFQKFLIRSQKTFDPQYGGFSESPKFPKSMQLGMLLRMYKRTGNKTILELVTKTLDGMARGAIYDQLGGGFHRYSTDQYWHIPHFEKMLYTNAALSVNYLEAYQITKNPEYAQIARETLDYILRDMTHTQGGFYSAEDADSEKTEGKFYVWTEDELKNSLTPDEMKTLTLTYHVTPQGNFNPDQQVRALEESAGMKAVEHANAFYLTLDQKLPNGQNPVLRQARAKLMKIRETRIRPGLDDKILTAWNGLTIHSMATAYQVLGDLKYLDAALKSAHFLLNHLRTPEGKLLRRWREGISQINAYLNDYAYLIQGILTLYQSDFDPYWYRTALQLQKQQDLLFRDPQTGSYFFNDASDSSLLQRKITFHDNALPSGNAVSALNLLKLADLSLNPTFREQAAKIISVDSLKMLNSPDAYSQMLIALDYLLDRSKEVAVVGSADHPLTKKVIRYLHREFLPNKVVAMGTPVEDEAQADSTLPLIFNKPMLKNRPTTYVCENNICQLPTSDLSKIQGFVTHHKKYSWEKP